MVVRMTPTVTPSTITHVWPTGRSDGVIVTNNDNQQNHSVLANTKKVMVVLVTLTMIASTITHVWPNFGFKTYSFFTFTLQSNEISM
jgi:hypothetical protein